MSGLSQTLSVTSGNGGAFANVTIPAPNAINPDGIDDKLLLIVGYDNSAGAVPPTPSGYTKRAEAWGGQDARALKDGPRGIVVFEKDALTAGTETGFTLNNGGSGTDRAIRFQHVRISLDTATAFGTTTVAADDDSTKDASAPYKMFIQPGANPSGVGAGDLVLAVGCWAQSDTNFTLGSQTIKWPGAVAVGSATSFNTGVANVGNYLRLNGVQAEVVGAGTGNLEGEFTFGAPVSGVGALIVVRGTGQPPIADPGPTLLGLEPGRPATLDGTSSDGNIASYTWQKESTPGSGSWSTVGTSAILTVTTEAAAAAHTERYRLRVTAPDGTNSAWVSVDLQVNGTTETLIDADGVERGVIIEAVE